MPSDAHLIDLLPRRLRTRFEGLTGYVSSVLQEDRLADRLSRNQVQVIQLVTFVAALDTFLRQGTRVAAEAVDTFEELGVGGFRVGSQRFIGRNNEVMRGQMLSRRLRDAIEDDQLLALIGRQLSLRRLIIECAEVLGRA